MSRAIIHFDGDSFFASVEQVMNHRLRGKALITGGERGAITSVSIEGKRLGINRGMTLRHARELCPQLVVVASDYTSYSIFARRMYAIVREFTPLVHEYSIDECFADITGLEGKYQMPYPDIALMIKRKLEANLGVTFGVGLAPNRVLAKVASKHRKPAGFTHIQESTLHDFLRDLPIGKVWGIGSASAAYLYKLGIRTALDLAEKDYDWITYHKIAKPYREIWQQLRGDSSKPLTDDGDDSIGSIIKSRTFSPQSKDRAYILSHLSKNIENACIKARNHSVRARFIRVYLKTQQFTYHSLETSLDIPLSTPGEIMHIISRRFDEMYQPGVLYRATGVSLSLFVTEDRLIDDLFGESRKAESTSSVFSVVDAMSRRYGKHMLFLGSSMRAKKKGEDDGETTLRLKGEMRRKSLELPFLGKVA